MREESKELYVKPKLGKIGTVASLTAALGTSSREDQNEFAGPQIQNSGSFDICTNRNEDEIC